MAEQRDVKVFISWSGNLAKEVAVALREWLPLLSDHFKPWTSDTDIEPGQRGLAHIEEALNNTTFGIVVVTASNQHAPWLNFEAGAMSKTIPGEIDQRVVPLMVDLTSSAQLTGPLPQFQAKVADQGGVRSLVRSLTAVARVDEGVVTTRFDATWPTFEKRISAAKRGAAHGRPAQPPRESADILEEVLVHVRQLRSDNESSSSPELARMHRLASESLAAPLASLATEHNLTLYDLDVNQGGASIAVAPMDRYSQDDVESFRRSVLEEHGGKVDVSTIVMTPVLRDGRPPV